MLRDLLRLSSHEAVPMSPPSAPAVLVIRQGAFGDLIQADGALRDIRAHHRDARIVLLVAPAYRRLMERCPHVDELVLDPRASLLRPGQTLAVLRRLRAQRFERVYDLQGSDRTAFYRRWMPGSGEWFRRHNPSDSGVPDREAYATLLAQAGIAGRSLPDVGWMADDVQALLDAQGIRPGYVVLVPGSAARHPHKRWPHYADLARRLSDDGRQVVVAPGPDELELTRNLPCHVLTGPSGYLDWFALAGVLRGAAFVIGNDTGPTHLAAGLGVPGLALFGPHTSANRTGIRMGRFDAIEVADLQALSVDAVMAEIHARIDAHPGSDRR
ncbi:glycosyltransferase family 9 protein [Lysobacter panacisoli]|uniref:Glycosyltransferase family 9 protein n=1 Tax=Lysobacter panacisoli TaxID=1255263 RepID=A0ABP9L9J8_9GAMM|nr:glycosyltransferase family 9 protein [Lysobacter panacisoli]